MLIGFTIGLCSSPPAVTCLSHLTQHHRPLIQLMLHNNVDLGVSLAVSMLRHDKWTLEFSRKRETVSRPIRLQLIRKQVFTCCDLCGSTPGAAQPLESNILVCWTIFTVLQFVKSPLIEVYSWCDAQDDPPGQSRSEGRVPAVNTSPAGRDR